LVLFLGACGNAVEQGTPSSMRFAVDTLRLNVGDAQSIPLSVLDAQNHDVAGATPTFTVDTTGGGDLTINGRQATGTLPGEATLVATLGSVVSRLPVHVFGHPNGSAPPQRLALDFRPYGVAVTQSSALVTQLDAGTVTRISLAPFKIVTAIPTGSVPTGISVNRAGTLALVTNQFDPSIGVIDLSSNQQVRRINGTSSTFRTIFSSDGSRGYATLAEGATLVIDPVGGITTARIPVVTAPNGIAFGAGDSLLYVTGMFGGISVLNAKTGAPVTTFQISGTLQDIVPTPDGTALFLASESNPAIAVVSTSSGTVTGTISLVAPAFGLALTPDRKQLWVTHTSGTVTVIDAATRTVLRTISLGGRPRRVAFDRFGRVAIVSDEMGSVVMIR